MTDDLARTLSLVPDDAADPSVAVERDHIAAAARIFTDPGWALPRLDSVAQRWAGLGVEEKEAWALANGGVASFYLSRMEESANRLERALGIFESVGDRPGAVAASSFLCLTKPTDPRVGGWLADALEFADAVGDRTKQVSTLSTLAWNHFFRSLCGGPGDVVVAEGFARRLTGLAGDLGAGEMEVHGHSLLAMMSRLTGRMDEAADHVVALEGTLGSPGDEHSWLGWAASFAVLVARRAADPPPRLVPESSSDPVVALAVVVIEVALALAGRVDEALARAEATRDHGLGSSATWPGSSTPWPWSWGAARMRHDPTSNGPPPRPTPWGRARPAVRRRRCRPRSPATPPAWSGGRRPPGWPTPSGSAPSPSTATPRPGEGWDGRPRTWPCPGSSPGSEAARSPDPAGVGPGRPIHRDRGGRG